jgi:hypothetical protein
MVLPGQIRQREGRAWLVRWQGARGILRQLPAAVPGALAGQAAADLAWLHAFLSRLDLSRVSRFLRGYAGVARVPADDARVIAVYMRGRGLQMIAKRGRRLTRTPPARYPRLPGGSLSVRTRNWLFRPMPGLNS